MLSVLRCIHTMNDLSRYFEDNSNISDECCRILLRYVINSEYFFNIERNILIYNHNHNHNHDHILMILSSVKLKELQCCLFIEDYYKIVYNEGGIHLLFTIGKACIANEETVRMVCQVLRVIASANGITYIRILFLFLLF